MRVNREHAVLGKRPVEQHRLDAAGFEIPRSTTRLALAFITSATTGSSASPKSIGAVTRSEPLAAAAGLTPGRTAEVSAPFVFPDLETAVRAHLSAGPARRAIEHAGPDATADALRAALAGSVQPDGSSRHDNAFRYLIAAA